MADSDQIRRHDSIVDSLISSAEITAIEVLKAIENRVAELIAADEINRAVIQQEIISRWNNWSVTVLNSLDRASADTILLHSELGLAPPEPTAEDVSQQTALKTAGLPLLMQPAESAVTDILAALAVGAVVGTDRRTLAQSARIKISGYLATVTDPTVVRLQELYRTQIRSRNYTQASNTLAQLRTAWGATPVGANLLAQSRTIAHDTVMDYDSVYGQWRGESLGVTVWRYAGGISSTTRDFCAQHAGKEYTREAARAIWSSQSWTGKRSGDPFVARGGYNCRHYWVPVNKNIVGRLRNLQQ